MPSVPADPAFDPARGGHVPPFETAPSSPPLYLTAAFDIPDLDVLSGMHAGNRSGYIYTRDNNPNHAALAATVASLEQAEAAAVFGSGMGAIAAVVLSLASAGQHMLVSRMLYGRTLQLAQRLQSQFQIDFTAVDPSNITEVKAAIRDNTCLCLVETVSNPLLDVVDLDALAATLGPVPLVVDSTFTTPELIRPLQHGAAAVVHSASKYLNGHGDVILGVAAGSKELIAEAAETCSLFGQNANPFDCWLTQRGLRTLSLRMQQVCRTTRQLAEFLQDHPQVRRVYYPLLESHPDRDTARRLYPQGTGGIITFVLNGDSQPAVSRLMRAAEHIRFSPTLADARTSISHPATTSHRYMPTDVRAELGITDGMIRLSVGLEPFQLLRDELDQALRATA